MWKDPIVEEIHLARQAISRQCEDSLDLFFERLKKGELESPHRLVSGVETTNNVRAKSTYGQDGGGC